MPKISVIVPVYMVEDYLDRCVQSIIDQTHRELEVILVNDGSPDRCGAMCDTWAQKDPRIRVIHKENGGLSDARNVGLEASTGEWIAFIDSDDYVHPKMLEALLCAALLWNTDVSIGGIQTVGDEKPVPELLLQGKLMTAEEVYLLAPKINDMSACAKLYRRECFAKIRYPKGRLNEDAFTTFRLLYEANKVAVVEGAVYFYYQSPASITRSTWKPANLDELDAYRLQISFFKEKGWNRVCGKKCRDFLKVARRQTMQVRNLPEKDIRHRYEKYLLRQIRKMLRQNKEFMNLSSEERKIQYTFAYPHWDRVYRKMYALRRAMCSFAWKLLGDDCVEKLKSAGKSRDKNRATDK